MWSERRYLEYLSNTVKKIDERSVILCTQFGGFEEAITNLKQVNNNLYGVQKELDGKYDKLSLSFAKAKGFIIGITMVVSFAISLFVSLYTKGG